MKRKHYVAAVLVVCSLCAVIIARYAFRAVIGDSGKTADVAVLRKAYRRAGPQFEALYTNALSEFLPSAGAVSWRRPGMRPSVTVTGAINLVNFRRFMTNHPSIHFIETGRASGGTEVFFRWIKDVGDAEIITDARADMTSGDFEIFSFFGICKHGNQ
jgi:hypothetical protein